MLEGNCEVMKPVLQRNRNWDFATLAFRCVIISPEIRTGMVLNISSVFESYMVCRKTSI
jgi:hypothetical protein